MEFYPVFFILLLLLLQSYADVTEKQLEIVLALSDHLGSKQCVFLDFGSISTVKRMSQTNVFSISMSLSKFQAVSQNFSSVFTKRTIVVTDTLLKASTPFLFYVVLFQQMGPPPETVMTASEYFEIYMVRPSPAGFLMQRISQKKILKKIRVRKFETRKQILAKLAADETDLAVSLTVGQKFDEGCDEFEKLPVYKRIPCFHDHMVGLMSERINITINEEECQERYNLYVFPNGSYSGLFKMLLDGEVDVSTGSFVVSPYRLTNFDFVYPTFNLRTMMYIKRSDEHEEQWDLYFKPFHPDIWYFSAGVIVASGLIIWFLHRSESKISDDETRCDVIDGFLSAFGMFCNQAGEEISNGISYRVYRYTVFLVASVIYFAYSGALLSSLAFYDPAIPFRDLEGFFSDGNYKITAVQDSFVPFFFKYDYIPKRKIRVEDYLTKMDRLPKNDKEGLDGLCDESYLSYIGIEENVLSLNRFKCEIVQIPSPMFIQHIGIGIRKHSPFREHFNRELAYLQSTGILKRLDVPFRSGKGKSPFAKTGMIFSMPLTKVVAIFAVLAWGVWASFCILLAELTGNNSASVIRFRSKSARFRRETMLFFREEQRRFRRTSFNEQYLGREIFTINDYYK